MKKEFILFCQACGRKIFGQEPVVEFMGFKICGDSAYCTDKIKNLPMFFVEDPQFDTFEIDNRIIGKAVRKGFVQTKYDLTKVSILNTSHYKFKSNMLIMLEIAELPKTNQLKEQEPDIEEPHDLIFKKSFPQQILEFENSLKEFDSNSLNGESNLTKIRMKRTLKRLRRVYKQLVVGSS